MDRIVLAEGSSFLVSDTEGDVPFGNTVGMGLYYRDTRFLSVLEMTVNGQRPVLLNSTAERTYMANVQLTNDSFVLPGNRVVPRQSISIRRDRFVEQSLKERINLLSYNAFPVPIEITLLFAGDFKDMFDVRGFRRESRGEILMPTCGGEILTAASTADVIALNYKGLDGVFRRTQLVFEQPPTERELIYGQQLLEERPDIALELSAALAAVESPPPGVRVTFRLVLEPDRPYFLTYYVAPRIEGEEYEEPKGSFYVAVRRIEESYEDWWTRATTIRSSNEIFGEMLLRGQIDLRGLSGTFERGRYPFAGIPWFFAPFGRDAITTAFQTLGLNPEIAVNVLRSLAATQGRTIDDWRDEQPGRIMHELRSGEMTRLGEVPHSPYYGSVDATPLFLVLFCETMDWLDDDQLYHDLLPAVDAALEWIDKYGDLDGDGLVEYKTRSVRGIRNQAWKDSYDAYQFPDGTIAEPPIASIEVQGYVYDAKMRLARLFRRRGRGEIAKRLEAEAAALREKVLQAFWMPDEQYYALGLDHQKRQITSVTSNAGYLLWSGLLTPDEAKPVVARLLSPDLFGGWGIRTLSQTSPNFNPMSYHNGSIWPHDNSLLAVGLRRYGYLKEANLVMSSIFDAGRYFQYYRLPELYCGFNRGEGFQSGPSEYPVSCSPQAWAAGSVFLFLTTMLGLQPNAAERCLRIDTNLPDWLQEVDLGNMRVGRSRVSLVVRGGKVDVLARTGPPIDIDIH